MLDLELGKFGSNIQLLDCKNCNLQMNIEEILYK